ncbi:MAG: hypothetical protein OEV99_08670 [Nitrospira sp.]|nr:hypothetical protein [Nitrospira sp.]MDH4369908.1 hypothetical protein [Nitrospira sp.]MDH5497352.1 hypothetical protein [Nitrospira sp.]MDH5725381.1 hypothetical protein [Nitrospira sp.]
MRNTHIASYSARTRPSRYSIVVFLLVFMSLSGVPNCIETASGEKLETLPIQKAAPAAVVIETAGSEVELRRQMRTKNGVTELRVGRGRFSDAPTGSYGFIAPTHLGLALVTQSPDLVLDRAASTDNDYEIHKLSDGSGLLVGFMGKELVAEVTPSDRPKNIRIALHSNVSDKAPVIVALPVIKLMVDRMPLKTDPKNRESAMVLEMDLQNTANRKSPIGH